MYRIWVSRVWPIHFKFHSSEWNAYVLTFRLWEMLRAPKSLNNEDVGEFTGSVKMHSL